MGVPDGTPMSALRPRHGYDDGYRDYVARGRGAEGLHVVDLEQTTLVVTYGWDSEPYNALRAALRPDVLLVNVADGDGGVAALDETEMWAVGWVRVVRAEDQVGRALDGPEHWGTS